MNDRIKELIKQSERVDHYTTGDYFPIMTVDGEKLAQLIVEECIDIVAAGGEFASRPKLVEKLQEHFGVEE